MIATSITLLLFLGTTLAYKPFEGVDPNTLSCDPEGQIFLLLPHFKYCNKFYMCDHGNEVEFECSSPELIFDFEGQGCIWNWAGKCVLRTPPEEIDPEGSGDESFEDVGWKMSTAPIGANIGALDEAVRTIVRPLSFETSATKQLKYGNILNCKRSETSSKRVAYSGDCQRYWRCDNGIPTTFYCSDGLFFNETTQQCDFEANSKCSVEQEDELKGEFILHK